jgi:uncharacterized membrane protein
VNDDPTTARAVDLLLQITKRSDRAIWILLLCPLFFGLVAYNQGVDVRQTIMFAFLVGLILSAEHNLSMLYLRNEFAKLASTSPLAATEARKQIMEMKKDRRFWRSLDM